MVMEGDAREIYFQVDDCWKARCEGIETIDVRVEAKELRFISSTRKIEAFYAKHGARFRPFTLTGSGDFHHLSAIWTRQFKQSFLLLSFDNHPDWDVRFPKWSCGAWINRLLENPLVRGASVWGCANSECDFPRRLLGNKRAALEGRLVVHPWRRDKEIYPHWLVPMTLQDWRRDLESWAARHPGERLYVSIDLDCLVASEAVTNWENGRFFTEDLVWALGILREKMEIIGGDLCGGYSLPSYANLFQRVAGWFDHPSARNEAQALRSMNEEARRRIWEALTGVSPDSTNRDRGD